MTPTIRCATGSSTPWLAVASVAGVGCAAGCGDARRRRAARAPLRVAAASDLQTALPELAERLPSETGRRGRRRPSARRASSPSRSRQGPRSTSSCRPTRRSSSDLADRGLVRPESVRPYARGSLVLAVHRESGGRDRGAGRPDASPRSRRSPSPTPRPPPTARPASRRSSGPGSGTTLEPKIVQAESVRQALQFVQTGNAEAALVGRAIAEGPRGPRRRGRPDACTTRSSRASGSWPRSTRPERRRGVRRVRARAEGQAILADVRVQGRRPPRRPAAMSPMPATSPRSGSRSGSPRWRRS